MKPFDVAVIGGGPAGLSAALVLGRCNQRVLLVDDGRYRNDRTKIVNGFITRDGTPPAMLRGIARGELARYDVAVVNIRALGLERVDEGFRVQLGDGRDFTVRAVVLATGVVDVLPQIPGLLEHYGSTIHHCPFCDAYEHKGKRIGVHGRGGGQLARMLRAWTSDVILFAEGEVAADERVGLADAGVQLIEEPVAAFVGRQGILSGAQLASGEVIPVAAVFLKLAGGQVQRSDFATNLGVIVRADGGLEHDGHGATTVPGLYVAGDVTRDLLLSIVAASEGAEVAARVFHYLQELR